MGKPDLPQRTGVLVVGAGPVGLVVSALLSLRGIENLVVERRRDLRRAPAAHVIRRRSMKILEEIGVAEELRRVAPDLPLDFITWCTTLGGVEIGRLELRPHDPETGERAAEPWTNCPQNLLEPLLLETARSRPEAQVVQGVECVSASQSVSGLTAQLRLDDGSEHRVDASWMVAADGAGSPTRRSLGIAMEGPGPLAHFAMVHFEADLRPWLRGRWGPIFWILNPASPGALIVHDPACSHVFMMPMAAPHEAEAEIPLRLAAALGLPLTPRILRVDHWSPHVQVAARYREGRIFLVGDAAHRFPPTGGLGMNTGIQEAFDLVERLARIEQGDAAEELLDGYESSCRPVARANALESFENLKRLAEVGQVLGTQPDLASLERRVTSLSTEESEQLQKAIEAQRSHFLSEGRSPLWPASP